VQGHNWREALRRHSLAGTGCTSQKSSPKTWLVGASMKTRLNTPFRKYKSLGHGDLLAVTVKDKKSEQLYPADHPSQLHPV